ncbi:helix-turn-helix domain-containing protein [Rhizobium sp. CFBP 8752]|uniref:helix-turn-helix domain-containing protein n=1 Tax=Rhizobium sp. CFBP 8752 TaxID=2775301 RepID=UPI001A7E65A8|nr:helix-turn-helix transcriptional regulator [Rhizobium sp. CFBP 8752]
MFPVDFDDDMFSLPDNEIAAAEFVAAIGREFQSAFLQRKFDCKLTQQGVANLMGVGRSHVHRLLSGHNNMTAETMAAFALALRATPKFTLLLDDIDGVERSNYFTLFTGSTITGEAMPVNNFTITAPPVTRVVVYPNPLPTAPHVSSEAPALLEVHRANS